MSDHTYVSIELVFSAVKSLGTKLPEHPLGWVSQEKCADGSHGTVFSLADRDCKTLQLAMRFPRCTRIFLLRFFCWQAWPLFHSFRQRMLMVTGLPLHASTSSGGGMPKRLKLWINWQRRPQRDWTRFNLRCCDAMPYRLRVSDLLRKKC